MSKDRIVVASTSLSVGTATTCVLDGGEGGAGGVSLPITSGLNMVLYIVTLKRHFPKNAQLSRLVAAIRNIHRIRRNKQLVDLQFLLARLGACCRPAQKHPLLHVYPLGICPRRPQVQIGSFRSRRRGYLHPSIPSSFGCTRQGCATDRVAMYTRRTAYVYRVGFVHPHTHPRTRVHDTRSGS